MTENKTKQKSWVSELNQSETDIKRKEKYNKLFKYFSIGIASIFLIGGALFIGNFKLKSIQPEIEIADINVDTSNSRELEVEQKVKKNIEKKSKQIIETKEVIVVETSNNIVALKKIETQNLNTIEKPQGRNGKYITYYDNGNKWVELFFVNGLREGTQYSWHKNGKIKSELNYANGKKNGSQKWWKKDGKILNHKFYENGEWVKSE